jgi:3-dehydroquinate synthase
VISDLAGFAAATWMRGIPHAFCPTTVEGAIDAAVGGKTAVNLPHAKNLVGAFHPPVFVGVDPDTFATLPARDISAGLAESIKHALITDPDFADWHQANADAVAKLEPGVLMELVVRNIQIKGRFVAEDPYERTGVRMALNFGHTIGHAIESCGRYRLRHGECVALGMIGACRLSAMLGLADEGLVDRVVRLLARFNLPTRLEGPVDVDALLDAMRRDKKSRGGRLRFVLLEGIGQVTLRDDVRAEDVREAIASLSY